MTDYIRDAFYEYKRQGWTEFDVDYNKAQDLFDILKQQKDYDDLGLETLADDIIHDLSTGKTESQILRGFTENKHLDFFYNYLGKEEADALLDSIDKAKIPYTKLTGIQKYISSSITVNLDNGNHLYIDMEWERQDGSPKITKFDVYTENELGQKVKIYGIGEFIDALDALYVEKETYADIYEENRSVFENNSRARVKGGEFTSHTGTRFKSYITSTGKTVYGYYKDNGSFRFVGKNSDLYREAVSNDKYRNR